MHKEELLPEVYGELRRLAASYLRGKNGTLQPTALVHEAYLRLQAGPWRNRAHFVGTAALSMRQVLSHEYERRMAQKRRGVMVELIDFAGGANDPAFDSAVLVLAFERLERFSRPVCRVVELRFFGGLSIEETADYLSVSPATVKRHWNLGRAFLARELTKHPPDGPGV